MWFCTLWSVLPSFCPGSLYEIIAVTTVYYQLVSCLLFCVVTSIYLILTGPLHVFPSTAVNNELCDLVLSQLLHGSIIYSICFLLIDLIMVSNVCVTDISSTDHDAIRVPWQMLLIL